jgi:catechol 2,3-dioxygenase-like lactoylglutathione lyase family enzyme
MEIRRAFVTIAASNLEQSVRFYEQLLSQSPTAHIPTVYAEFQIRGIQIGIYQPRDAELSSTHPAVSLCLEVENLTAAIAHLISLDCPPPGEILHSSHGEEIYAYDPDGNRIILYQPKTQ